MTTMSSAGAGAAMVSKSALCLSVPPWSRVSGEGHLLTVRSISLGRYSPDRRRRPRRPNGGGGAGGRAYDDDDGFIASASEDQRRQRGEQRWGFQQRQAQAQAQQQQNDPQRPRPPSPGLFGGDIPQRSHEPVPTQMPGAQTSQEFGPGPSAAHLGSPPPVPPGTARPQPYPHMGEELGPRPGLVSGGLSGPGMTRPTTGMGTAAGPQVAYGGAAFLYRPGILGGAAAGAFGQGAGPSTQPQGPSGLRVGGEGVDAARVEAMRVEEARVRLARSGLIG